MTLKYGKTNLSQEKKKVFYDYFKPNDFGFNNDEKSKSKNHKSVIKEVYKSINKSERNNIKNENEKKKNINYDNNFQTNINDRKENDLLNSKMTKIKLNNKNKVMFLTQILDGQNQPYDCNIKEKKSLKKRGRVKLSHDNRFHSKNDKDNINLKIHGLIINTFLSFINKKLKKKNLRKLRKLKYKEKRKFSMDKKLKDIYGNASKKFGKNYNKDIINECDQILKEIFELPMYKVILAISGVEINILKGLDHEYNLLKNKLLLKEDDDYINLFNEREANIINLAKNKYPIIKVNTKIEGLNSKINIDFNCIYRNNAKKSEINEFSNEKTTKAKTFDSKKNIDKAFMCNTNNENLDIKMISYQDTVIESLFFGPKIGIPNFNDSNEEKDEIFGVPHLPNNNNIGDSESSSSKYSFMKIKPGNDDIF